MPIAENGPLGPGFERRLKAALDSVSPPSPLASSARYRAGARRPVRPWRYAPVLAGGAAAAMALTAAAATGSPNPVIWTERAGSVIQSVSHVPGASPKAAQSPRPEPSHQGPSGQGPGPGSATPSSSHEVEPSPAPEPTETPEASPKPEASPSPEPSSDHSGGDHPEPSPTPDGGTDDS